MAGGDTKTKKGPSFLGKAYLIAYNSIESLGWSYILFKLIFYYLSPSKLSLYETVEVPLIIFQNAAVMEVVHAVIRLVPSNPVITALQISSRVIVVCGVLIATQTARESFGLHLALLAWSVTEIVRYGNYALNLLDAVPYFLVWLRYSTFIILYPIGVTGELLCIFAASQEVGQTRALTIDMPNSLNFIFDYQKFLWFLMLLYIPIFPRLYSHMLALRIKILGPPSKKSK